MKSIRNVLVAGAGTMGHSIALAFAKGGRRVCLVDLTQEILDAAMGKIRVALDTLIDHGFVTEDAATVFGRITPTLELEGNVPEADMVVEVIFERPEVKTEFFTRIAPLCGPDTLVCSNTSMLNAFDFMPPKLHDRAFMTHYFVPPHLIPLVEVVATEQSGPAYLNDVLELLREIKMKPVVLKHFIAGFLVNRLQRALNREVFQLIGGEYTTAEELDTAIKIGLGIRMPILGVLGKADLAGLDLMLNNFQIIDLGLVNNEDPPPLLERMVAEGRKGFKSGRGFFDYTARPADEQARERDAKIIKVIRMVKELGEL